MNRSMLVAVMVLGTACAHARKPEDVVSKIDAPPAPRAPRSQLEATVTTAPVGAATSPGEQGATKDLAAALAVLRDSTLLFGTDDWTITSDGSAKLAQVGLLLAAHPALAIRVEGNCDERGTEDYNLSLGQRRASAAKQYLLRMGARDGQIGTISYGEERPKEQGHDQSAWSRNRRDDIVVTGGAR